VSWGERSTLHRTAKLLLDRGLVASPDEAVAYLRSLVLQVAVGPDIADVPAAVAALATVINTAHRVFLGGVRVRLRTDPLLRTGWADGLHVSELVTRYGGIVVDELDTRTPTVQVLDEGAVGKPVASLGWNGWSGGVLVGETFSGRGDNAVSGVLAGALGVSEMFQHALGAVMPGRRSVGISLWMPGADWRSVDAAGPSLEYLPAKFWLLGLGHLGQALAWTIGFLPYADPAAVEVGLVDFDHVEEGNLATQLLTTELDVNRKKARVVAEQLETRGLRTRVVERAFDASFRPIREGKPEQIEPSVALAGFDRVSPRRHLDVFEYAVDAGLGTGPVEYLDSLVRSFSGSRSALSVFGNAEEAGQPVLGPKYEAEIARRVAGGEEEGAARCGMLEIAGVTVGASFVGAVVSCLVIADLLRNLHDGVRLSSIGLDLRNPAAIQVAEATVGGEDIVVPFTRALIPPSGSLTPDLSRISQRRRGSSQSDS
jgi:hypothetical protein